MDKVQLDRIRAACGFYSDLGPEALHHEVIRVCNGEICLDKHLYFYDPWSAAAVSAVIHRAGLRDWYPIGLSCRELHGYGEFETHALHEVEQGDIILFDYTRTGVPDHAGICLGVDDYKITMFYADVGDECGIRVEHDMDDRFYVAVKPRDPNAITQEQIEMRWAEKHGISHLDPALIRMLYYKFG